MSVAGDIITDVLSKLATQLGSTFSELPDLFDTDGLSSRELQNGYSAILLDGGEGDDSKNLAVIMTRVLRVKVSYKTFTRRDGSKTKTVLQTLYTNEEDIIKLLSNYQSKPAGLIGIVKGLTTLVEKEDGEEDNYLINTIDFSCKYSFNF